MTSTIIARGSDLLDTIVGTDGRDLIIDFSRDSRIESLGDDDQIVAYGGRDFVLGGAGNDLVFAGNGDDTVFGEAGRDMLHGGNGDDRLDGGRGHDRLFGGAGDDDLLGGAGDDWLAGNSGADILRGGAGDDVLVSGPASDSRSDVQGIPAIVNDGTRVALHDGALSDQSFSVSYSDTAGPPALGSLQFGNALVTEFDFDAVAEDRNPPGNPIIPNRQLDILEGGAGHDTFVFSGRAAAIVDFNAHEDRLQSELDLVIAEIVDTDAGALALIVNRDFDLFPGMDARLALAAPGQSSADVVDSLGLDVLSAPLEELLFG